MQETLKISELSFFINIGTDPWEKNLKRKVLISVELQADFFIDYVQVKHNISSLVVKGHYPHIEDLAQTLLAELKKQFLPEHIQLTVTKPEALYCSSTSFTIQC